MDAALPLYNRPLTSALVIALADTPVVGIIGPRQCGKSTLAHSFAPGHTYYSLDDNTLLDLAWRDPAGFIASLSLPAIIDEIQRAPGLLLAIKLTVDRDRQPGRFILTGSANLLQLPTLSDSLAGRIELQQLHPLTEAEKARVPGNFLQALLEDQLQTDLQGATAPAANPSLAERIIAGGYPEPLTRSPARARVWHRDYLRTLIARDVPDVARVKDASEIARLLELLALRTGELLNVTTLSNELDLRRETVEHYLAILERLFLVRRLLPWHRHESKRLIKTPKIHLLDTGLASTLAGLQVADWMTRREKFGHFVETFVVQQLVAQSGWTDSTLRFWHYRDKDQVEVDLVLTRGKQTWGIEVKSSASVTASDGAGLRRLANLCGDDFQRGILFHTGNSTLPMADPRFLAVPISKLWTM